MRRFMFGMLVLSFFLGTLVGCQHVSGVCDCDLDDDPCLSRAPWVRTVSGPPVTTHPDVMQKMPSAR